MCWFWFSVGLVESVSEWTAELLSARHRCWFWFWFCLKHSQVGFLATCSPWTSRCCVGTLLYFWTHESSSLLLHNTNFVHWDSTAAEIDAAAQVLVRIPQWRFNWAWLSAGYSSKSSRVLLLNTSTWVCAASYLKVNIVFLLHYHLTAASLCRCGF